MAEICAIDHISVSGLSVRKLPRRRGLQKRRSTSSEDVSVSLHSRTELAYLVVPPSNILARRSTYRFQRVVRYESNEMKFLFCVGSRTRLCKRCQKSIVDQ